LPEHPHEPGRQIPDAETAQRRENFLQRFLLWSLPIAPAVLAGGYYLSQPSEAQLRDAVVQAYAAKLEIGDRKVFKRSHAGFFDQVVVERIPNKMGRACYSIWGDPINVGRISSGGSSRNLPLFSYLFRADRCTLHNG
jgi:hypothetical protein